MLPCLRTSVLLCFLVLAIGASAQVLSYSTYLPGFAPNGSMAAVNNNGEICAVSIHTHPFAGTKFSSDGSVQYNMPLDALTSLDVVTADHIATNLVAIDSSGNCYLAGYGQINPTPGAFQTVQKYSPSPWIAKFDGSGKLIFATYFSGSGNDIVYGMAADSDGKVYVTGTTSSNDFPTLHAYQPALSGGSAVFISVLDPTGTSLIYSTYFGSSGTAPGNTGAAVQPSAGIAVDAAHNAYITGTATIPLLSAMQTTPAGTFVAKLDATGMPVYSTYLGPGNPPSQGTAIAVDSSGAAYVAGYSGRDYKVFAIPNLAFVYKISADGSALLYSASLWGDNSVSTGIAVDASGQAYVSGYATNVPFVSPIVTLPGSGGFVSVLNTAGTALTFSTGVGANVEALSVGLDSIPNIYVSGMAATYGLIPLLKGTFVVPDPTFLNIMRPGYLSKISLSPGTSLSVPDALDFGQANIPVGKSVSAGLFVANTSASGNISISNIAITAGDFTQTNSCLKTLGPAVGCAMTVLFAPTAVGTRTGTITITDSAPGSPHVINLTGTGLVPPPIYTVSPSSLTFPAQAVATTSSAQGVTLNNPSSAVLGISRIDVSGDFTETNTCGGGLGPQTSGANACVISVFFAPTATGTRMGELSVSFTGSIPLLTVPLSGQGAGPSLGLSAPQGGSSAVVNAGGTASYTLLIGGAGMGGTASMSCTGAPRGASCTLPSPVTIDAVNQSNLNVAVSTTARVAAASWTGRVGWLWASAILGWVVLPWSQMKKKAARSYLPLALVSTLLLPSCGSGSSSGSPNSNGTPAGNYTLTVTATSGSNTQSQNLTLTVQ